MAKPSEELLRALNSLMDDVPNPDAKRIEEWKRSLLVRETTINNALLKCKQIRARISEVESKYLGDRRGLQLQLEAAENERNRACEIPLPQRPASAIYWMSPVPLKCETCNSPITNLFYDAKTKMGPWACMCPSCFNLGPGYGKVGTGLGQEFTKAEDGKFYKTKG